MIRPDDFVVGTGPIDAEITNLFYLGEHVQTIFRLPDDTELIVALDRYEGSGITPGEHVALDIDTSRIHAVAR